MGYSLEAAHTGHGAMQQIASANLETDPIDAYKLALAAKDLWMGRRYIRTAHPSSDENMRTKALCRIVAECAEVRDETDLRIKEYIPLHNIDVPAGYKHVWTKGSTKSLLERNDPALTIMVNMLNHAISRIDHAEERLEEIYRDYDGVRMLRSIKGIAARTAAYILTAIDGIERHDAPEKPVPYFGFAAVHRESAGNVKKGHITKEGDPLVRRYIAGAVIKHSSYCPDSGLSQSYRRLKKTKAHRCAVTAAAGKPTCIIWAILTRKEEYRFHPEA